uniref:Uncharacterized protein n=1 Tax=Romanomermis culicivorax TaxID=13658 RepID=A0A915J5J0_ROMCU
MKVNAMTNDILYEDIAKNIQSAAEKSKKYFDKKSKERGFKVKDWVLLKVDKQKLFFENKDFEKNGEGLAEAPTSSDA